MGERGITPERHAQLLHQFGLDRPLWEQYLNFVGSALQGDLGRSMRINVPVRDLVRDKDSFVTRGATYDNQFNLAGKFIKRLRQKYEGTRLGRQEIYAEILDDTPGALWTRKMIDDNRRTGFTDLVSVAIGCDPSISSAEESDECGLIAAGIDVHGHGVVLEDGSLRGSPLEWARAAVALYKKHKADCIVAEANQGGELVSTVLHTVDPNVPVVLVHATRGKIVRAHPVAALARAQGGGGRHVAGKFLGPSRRIARDDGMFLLRTPDAEGVTGKKVDLTGILGVTADSPRVGFLTQGLLDGREAMTAYSRLGATVR